MSASEGCSHPLNLLRTDEKALICHPHWLPTIKIQGMALAARATDSQDSGKLRYLYLCKELRSDFGT